MGRKMSKEEWFERRISPVMKKLHDMCRERGIPMMMLIGYKEDGGAFGCLLRDEDGDDLPHSEHVRDLVLHHEMLLNPDIQMLRGLITEKMRSLEKNKGGDGDGCDGCGACKENAGEIKA